MLWHCARAALAMVCAMASGILFWVTSCAPAGDDSSAVAPKIARALQTFDMNRPPWQLGDYAAPSGAYPFQPRLVRRRKNLRRALFLEFVAGPEDPPHHAKAQAQKKQRHADADGVPNVGDLEEAPAETADQIDHRIKQRDFLPERRQYADRIESAAQKRQRRDDQ